MRNIVYKLIKFWIKTGLHLYYEKIEVFGLENVPKDAAVLFLPNHQSALLDVLLIAVDCNRKPYFLTRSDVFKGQFLKAVFSFFQMIPIYRIRDGRESLKNNQAVFDACADLFKNQEAILMFPEANHNVKRRVRPLSKGFTRILFNALDRAPESDIQIVPVGINYRNSVDFPDRVALYFDKPIPVSEMYDVNDVRESVEKVKEKVSNRIKHLTTHIADEENYDAIVKHLDSLQVNYLKPDEVNKTLGALKLNTDSTVLKNKGKSIAATLLSLPFLLLNAPLIFLWKSVFKPKVWEPEFTGTLRFAFALLAYPFYFMILFAILSWVLTANMALIIIALLFFYNIIHVKYLSSF